MGIYKNEKMRILGIIVSALLVCALSHGQEQVKLETYLDSVSYALGMKLAESAKKQKMKEVDNDKMVAGFDKGFNNQEGLISKKDVDKILQSYLKEQLKREKIMNKEKGTAFLSENGKREGVQTTESGLQYEVLTPAEGPKPEATDKVTVHYTGTLIDGTKFDSSVDRGEPATFGLNQVIRGWTEGVQLMSKGAKYRFYIPSELGYGERGAGSLIGPNSTLIFDVELLEIQ